MSCYIHFVVAQGMELWSSPVQSAALVNLVAYPRLQLVVTVDERGLIKVWEAENGCEKAAFLLPMYSSALEACDIPEGPLLLVSNLAPRSLSCFPASVGLAPDHRVRWHLKPGPPRGRPSDLIILLGPPAPPCLPCGGQAPHPPSVLTCHSLLPGPVSAASHPLTVRSSPMGCRCFLVHMPLLSCLPVLLIVFLSLLVTSHNCILTLLSPFQVSARAQLKGKQACSTECKHLPEMIKAFCCQDIWFGGDS